MNPECGGMGIWVSALFLAENKVLARVIKGHSGPANLANSLFGFKSSHTYSEAERRKLLPPSGAWSRWRASGPPATEVRDADLSILIQVGHP
jgi:hypothetical protein